MDIERKGEGETDRKINNERILDWLPPATPH